MKRIQKTWMFGAACGFSLVLLFAAYSNHFHNSFHFDDDHVIETNLYIRSLKNIPAFFTDARTFSSLPANSAYRPIVTLSLALDYWLGGGLDPWQFHLSQFLILLSLGLMLYCFFLTLLNMAEEHWWNRYVALVSTLLFSVHTANTETVNYICARSELLSTMGVVGSFLMYLAFPRWRRTYLYLLPMAIGALAKPPAVIFAPLFSVYLLFFEKQLSIPDLFSSHSWKRVREALWESAPAFLVGIVLFQFVDSMNAPLANYGDGGRLQYLQTQVFAWLHYGRLFVLPLGLTADTDLKLFSDWYDTRVAAGLLFFALLLRLCWNASKSASSRPVAFGVAWFWLALLPASSVFPLAEVTNDHRVFFPYIGLSLAAGWWIALRTQRWSESQPWLRPFVFPATSALAVLVLCGHAIGTYKRNTVWATEETLWRDVIEKSPTNGRALMNYGLTQMSQGKYAEAKSLFEKATVYTPNYSYLETNLGIVTDRTGDVRLAEQHFQRALQLQPDYVGGRYFYARWLVDQGRATEAIPHLQRAIALSPALTSARTLLINLYFAKGAGGNLHALLQETLTIAPSDPTALAYAKGEIPLSIPASDARGYYNRGVTFTNEGRHLDAALTYRQALKFDSSSADAYNNLGWSLVKLGFPQEAIPIFEQALHFRPDFALAQQNLNWAKTKFGSQP
jgi:tetratricopeptide (TPR) repeat protein